MKLELSDEQVAELQGFLESVIGDLHSEIAGTDNADYRHGLQHRLGVLNSIRSLLAGQPEPA